MVILKSVILPDIILHFNTILNILFYFYNPVFINC